jgi:RNA polymerase sigma factor (sigma-70 family)
VARELTEGEVIALARRGDGDAYASLVRAHSDIAFRTAMLITQDAADAEEAAQDAFVKAWRALGRFREGAPFRPWLLQIVANEARNRRRSAGRREHLVLRAATEEPSGEAAPSPEAALLTAETRERLLAAVNELPDDQREVISLRYFLELSEQEVAETLGIAQGTVKSRTARALERLRESYD